MDPSGRAFEELAVQPNGPFEALAFLDNKPRMKGVKDESLAEDPIWPPYL